MIGKLRALGTHLPDASGNLIGFAAYYASKLDPGHWRPETIALYWELCVTDMENGRDGFKSRPLDHPFVCLSRAAKQEIALSAPKVFEAVLPRWFADQATKSFKRARNLP